MEITKRMNVTKLPNGTMINTNTSEVLNGTDVIIEVNEGRNSVIQDIYCNKIPKAPFQSMHIFIFNCFVR